jgi:hypothetical protein
MRRKFLRLFRFSERCFLILLLLLSALTGTAQLVNKSLVSPLQSGHYQAGTMNIRDFADPAPSSGLFVLDYNFIQSGDQFYGATGQQVTQITGPTGSKVALSTNVSGYINDPMLLWASKGKVLGATYFGGVNVPVITVSSNLGYSFIGHVDSLHKSGNINGQVSGLSDLNIFPVYLSWGLTNLDVTVGWSVYAPTGKFSVGGSDNTGLGYWSNLFQAFGYWYPEKVGGKSSKALAIMLGASYEVIGKIKGTDVSPGSRFYLDYGIEQYFSNNLSFGLFGGNDWQVGNDKGSQVYWNTSVHDRLGVAGAQLAYWIWTNRLQFIAKYGFNYGAVEHFKQNIIELNLIFISNALTKKSKPA